MSRDRVMFTTGETLMVLETASGSIPFTTAEALHYERLFSIANVESASEIAGDRVGRAFLSRSALLDRETLREVWRLACGGSSRGALNKEGWFIAMKLIAFAQQQLLLQREEAREQRVAVSMAPLYAGISCPQFPDLAFPTGRDADLSPYDVCRTTDPDEEELLVVRVSEATEQGGNYSKYIEYNLHTRTSLSHFPRRGGDDMRVLRRFSDFEWLHDRLRYRFQGVIVPPMPEKKYFGNLNQMFVDARMRALERYINAVARHPKLRRAIELQLFLDASAEGLAAGKALMPANEFKTWDGGRAVSTEGAPAAASAADGEGDGDGEGDPAGRGSEERAPPPKQGWGSWVASGASSLWGGVKYQLGMAEPVPEVEVPAAEEYTQAKESLDACEPASARLCDAVAASCGCVRNHGRALTEAGQAVAAFGETVVGDSQCRTTLEGVGHLMEDIACELCAEADTCEGDSDDALIAPLQYQRRMLKSVREVVENRERAVAELQSANASLDRNKKRFAASRAQTPADAAHGAVLEAKMARAQDRMDAAQEQAEFIAASLVEELAAFRVERRKKLVAVMNFHAGKSADAAARRLAAWQALRDTLNLTDEEHAESAARIARDPITRQREIIAETQKRGDDDDDK